MRLLRVRQGLTQEVVGARAKLTKAMLSSYEIGAKLPSFQSLAAILEALQANFHDLQEALEEIRKQPPALGSPINARCLGKALRLLRTRQGLTQVTVAGKAKLTKAMLSCYETGSQLPSMQSLAATLDALEADFHDLQEALDQIQESSPPPDESAAPPRRRRRQRQPVPVTT